MFFVLYFSENIKGDLGFPFLHKELPYLIKGSKNIMKV